MANWSVPRTGGMSFGAGASAATQASYDAGLRSYMLSVYNYMASGVLLTGLVAMLFAGSGLAYQILNTDCLKENRYGQVLVDLSGLDHSSLRLSDYSAIGSYVGRTLVSKNPVIVGLPKVFSQDQIRFLISAMPTAGAISLCHLVGITPEAPTVEAALGGKPPEDRIFVGPEEMKSSYRKLTTTAKEDVDMVTFGCPHCSIPQIREIASLLEGKRVSPNTRLWVATSGHLRNLAQRMGYVEIIEHAGGLVLADLCVAPGAPFHLVQGVKTVAINSARGAYFIPGACNVDVIFGDTEDCVQAAIDGKWRGPR